MGAKDRWVGGGPEALSVRQWLDALSEHHNAVCSFTITANGNDKTGPQLMVRLTAQPGPIPELYNGPLRNAHEEMPFPSYRFRSLEALMFALCVRMDRHLGNEWWAQKDLPF